MNIFVVLILLSYFDIPVIEVDTRASRRHQRDRAIAHNRRVYNNRVGSKIWFDKPDNNGIYRRYASGQYHTNSQQGRWATERLSGHRRFEKWCRDYYQSLTYEKEIRRWKADLKDYFEE